VHLDPGGQLVHSGLRNSARIDRRQEPPTTVHGHLPPTWISASTRSQEQVPAIRPTPKCPFDADAMVPSARGSLSGTTGSMRVQRSAAVALLLVVAGAAGVAAWAVHAYVGVNHPYLQPAAVTALVMLVFVAVSLAFGVLRGASGQVLTRVAVLVAALVVVGAGGAAYAHSPSPVRAVPTEVATPAP
jgi:hypothetical protein